MAFDSNKIARIGSSQTTQIPTIWQYISSSDTINTISADGYFNEIIDRLQIGDRIFIVDSANKSAGLIVQSFLGGTVKTESDGPGEFKVVAGGTHLTTGGSATESFPVSGVLVSDVTLVTMNTPGAATTINRSIALAGAVEVAFNVDPTNNTIVNYMVFRAVV
jgi:hypothetical protein